MAFKEQRDPQAESQQHTVLSHTIFTENWKKKVKAKELHYKNIFERDGRIMRKVYGKYI